MSSNKNNEEDDCLGCRLASGGGLFAASIYIYRHSLNKSRINRNGMLLFSAVFGVMGVARLFNLLPFRQSKGVNRER
ncbi:hypothetical protein PVAND_011148 [Polypedilum vanderplanki]|uniref:Distal membrane-arm assembly complex protein 1-like domain-containing protein n=1 Tax=Polypedilum vanderplanki TaxID=319348 RepID=A0A9J6CJ34_POLVA|nr:hypothetical protein PVAND_011148 [Polypedilum vanderplanki]